MARTSVLNEDMLEKAANELRAGASMATLADCLGVSERVLYNWRAKGEAELQAADEEGEAGDERDLSLYARFVLTFRQAKGEAIAGAEKRVYQDAPLAWLTKGPGRASGWGERLEVDANVQADVRATLTQQEVSAMVVLPSDVEDPDERAQFERALDYLKEHHLDYVEIEEEEEEIAVTCPHCGGEVVVKLED